MADQNQGLAGAALLAGGIAVGAAVLLSRKRKRPTEPPTEPPAMPGDEQAEIRITDLRVS